LSKCYCCSRKIKKRIIICSVVACVRCHGHVFIDLLPNSRRFLLAPLFRLSGVMSQYIIPIEWIIFSCFSQNRSPIFPLLLSVVGMTPQNLSATYVSSVLVLCICYKDCLCRNHLLRDEALYLGVHIINPFKPSFLSTVLGQRTTFKMDTMILRAHKQLVQDY
jgi:hypothetical protein